MKKHLRFRSVLFLSLIIIIVAIIVLSQGGWEKINPFTTSPEPLPVSFSYARSNVVVETGYFSVFDNKSGAIVVIRILELYEKNGQVYGYLSTSNYPQSKQRIIFFDSKLPLLFISQKTKEVFPLSADTTSSVLKNKDDIFNRFNKLQKNPIILTLLFDSDINKDVKVSSEYLKCNRQFIEKLEDGVSDKSLDCSLFVSQLSAYEP